MARTYDENWPAVPMTSGRANSRRAVAVFVGVLLLLTAWPARAVAQDLQLTLGSDGTHTLPDGTQLLFKTKRLRSCDDNVDQWPIQGETPSYRVYVDDNISVARGGYVRYRLIFEPTAGQPGDEFLCQQVWMQPKGPFHDRIDTVPFEVGPENALERGELQLRLYSISPTPYLEPILDDEPYPIWLGSINTITFGLKNINDGRIPAEINFARVTYDDSLWEETKTTVSLLGATGGVEDSVVLTAPGIRDDVVQVELRPSITQVLSAITPLLPTSSVTVVLTYATQPAGTTQELLVELPIRFFPSLPVLFLSVTLGALVGTGLTSLGPANSRKARTLLHHLAVAILAGLVFETVGMLLVVFGDSSLRFLSIEVDPRRIMWAVLLGVFAGLYGFRSYDLLKRWAGAVARSARPAGDET